MTFAYLFCRNYEAVGDAIGDFCFSLCHGAPQDCDVVHQDHQQRVRSENEYPIEELKDLQDSIKDAQNMVVADRISALPDDVLVSIVSLMPLKEAAATSVLSPRWRYIWTFITTLDFHHDVLLQLRSYTRVRIETELDRYLDWVDSVVKQHRGLTIKLLRVYVDLNDSKFESSIHTWIRFAFEKRIENLCLCLAKNKLFPKRGGNEIKAGFGDFHKVDNVDKSESGLCIQPDILHPCVDRCFSAITRLNYLRALDFISVKGLAGQVLECFLSHCPVLERLTVIRPIRLDTLKLIDEINLLLRNVPQLVELSISSRRLSIRQCDSHYQLEVYRVRGYVLNNEKRVLATYVNLKHLEIALKEHDDCCLILLASFMRASPYLHKLVLKLARNISVYYIHGDDGMEIKQAPKCSHQFLRVVEVAHYHGRTGDLELVKYLTENAVELKKLLICPVREWFSRDRIRIKYGRRFADVEKVERKQATRQLKKLVPSSLEFICRL